VGSEIIIIFILKIGVGHFVKKKEKKKEKNCGRE
jgi:hypothetical protein